MPVTERKRGKESACNIRLLPHDALMEAEIFLTGGLWTQVLLEHWPWWYLQLAGPCRRKRCKLGPGRCDLDVGESERDPINH
jgi:hypothetical protein